MHSNGQLRTTGLAVLFGTVSLGCIYLSALATEGTYFGSTAWRPWARGSGVQLIPFHVEVKANCALRVPLNAARVPGFGFAQRQVEESSG